MNVKVYLVVRMIRKSQEPAMSQISGRAMNLEVEQAHRSTLIVTVYFFFLLFFIAKKCYVLFVYKHLKIQTPIECEENPDPVFKMTKPSEAFVGDLCSTVNFFIFIYTGSKFRSIFISYMKTVKNFFLWFLYNFECIRINNV